MARPYCSRRQLLVSGLIAGVAGRVNAGEPPHELHVHNAEELSAALERASAGDQIVLTNGTYVGDFSLKKSGTPTHPIVIRAADPHASSITGTVYLEGDHNILYQVSVNGVQITGSHCRVSRNRLTALHNTGILIRAASPHFIVEYNEIANFTGRGIYVRPATNPSHGGWIHHNYVHHQLDEKILSIGLTGGSHEGAFVPHHCLIEYNLVEGAKGFAFQAKTSDCVFQFNTARNCFSGFLQRIGDRGIFVGNACVGTTTGFRIHGTDCQVIGNLNEVASANFDAFIAATGTTTSAEYLEAIEQKKPQWARAENCLFAGNIGPIWIGGGASSWHRPALNCRLEAHQGEIVLVSGKQRGTSQGISAAAAIPPYVILHPSDVGPYADL